MSDSTWLEFAGTNDTYAVTGTVAALASLGDFTAAVRCRYVIPETTNTYPYIFSSSGTERFILVNYAFATPSMRCVLIEGGSTYDFAMGTLSGGWDNIAMWRSGGDLYGYNNGTVYGPFTASSGTIESASGAFILSHYGAFTDALGAFEGDISRSGFWTSARTKAQLDDWFAAAASSGSPAHAWAIDEGTGTTAADAISTADFTITGATWFTSVVNIAATDALAAGTTETAALDVTVAQADTLGTALTEVATLYVTVAAVDALTIATSEAASVSVILAGSDALGLSLAEIAAVDAAIAAADTLATALAETAALDVTVATTETLAVAAFEVPTLDVTVARADALSIRLIIGGLYAGLVDSEGNNLVDSEGNRIIVDLGIPEISAVLDAADALGLSLAETATIVAILSRSDDLSLALAEAAALFVAVNRVDALDLTLGEVAAIYATVATSDTVTAAITEAATVVDPEAVTAKAASDSLTTATTESTSVTALAAAVDALTTMLSEIPTLDVTVARSDTLSVRVLESGPHFALVDDQDNIIVDDQGNPILGAISTPQIIVLVATLEALGLSLDETVADFLVALAASDIATARSTEVAAIAATLSRVDELRTQIAELGAIYSTQDAAGDANIVGLTETASILVMMSASDALGILATEATAIDPNVEDPESSSGTRRGGFWPWGLRMGGG